MKSQVLSFCFSLLAAFVVGQNLVPNPSFEEHTGCPQGFPDLDGVCHNWQSFRGTPDYMHDCAEFVGWSNQLGYQIPNSGLAYAGFGVYQPTLPNQGNEHIGVDLLSPLEIGTEYFVTFHVSCGYTPLLVNIATNKIGALFTVNAYSDPQGTRQMPNNCQVFTNEIVSDTVIWTLISGSFIADSAYQYIVIGNFFEDVYLDTLNHPFLVVPQVAYYFLDDVCVSTDSLYAHTWTGIRERKGSDYQTRVFPNPSIGRFNVLSENRIAEIQVFDSRGKLIWSDTINGQKAELDISRKEAGLYLLCLFFSNGNREIIRILKE
jgi:hypothetical protein